MNIGPGDLFSALAHDTRLRCLLLLLEHRELCVCELIHATGLAQPHVSRHLAQLRQLGLVADRRQGQWIHYRLHPKLPAWVVSVLQDTLEGMAGSRPFSDDRVTLERMPDRPGTPHCA